MFSCFIQASVNDFGQALQGYCVDKNGQGLGDHIHLARGDWSNEAGRQRCLAMCAATPGVTACDMQYQQGLDECFAHTVKGADHANGEGTHKCYILKPKVEEPKYDVKYDGRFGEAQQGWCVFKNGGGVADHIDLGKGDWSTEVGRQRCLAMCASIPAAKACDMQYGFNDGDTMNCYAHTDENYDHGNGDLNHKCYVLPKKNIINVNPVNPNNQNHNIINVNPVNPNNQNHNIINVNPVNPNNQNIHFVNGNFNPNNQNQYFVNDNLNPNNQNQHFVVINGQQQFLPDMNNPNYYKGLIKPPMPDMNNPNYHIIGMPDMNNPNYQIIGMPDMNNPNYQIIGMPNMNNPFSQVKPVKSVIPIKPRK